ncbi:conserved Plasmodium protein, unknown function [Plasmodium gaboni]|uniref:Uncharacterized protein n=1 Tax=Plasmodium gaboni TaxID=647221 RepID=A0ABY1UMY5_9APIC|nr:conserved Plasmodium protein, unknown function [Plasmodium gaboni]
MYVIINISILYILLLLIFNIKSSVSNLIYQKKFKKIMSDVNYYNINKTQNVWNNKRLGFNKHIHTSNNKNKEYNNRLNKPLYEHIHKILYDNNDYEKIIKTNKYGSFCILNRGNKVLQKFIKKSKINKYHFLYHSPYISRYNNIKKNNYEGNINDNTFKLNFQNIKYDNILYNKKIIQMYFNNSIFNKSYNSDELNNKSRSFSIGSISNNTINKMNTINCSTNKYDNDIIDGYNNINQHNNMEGIYISNTYDDMSNVQMQQMGLQNITFDEDNSDENNKKTKENINNINNINNKENIVEKTRKKRIFSEESKRRMKEKLRLIMKKKWKNNEFRKKMIKSFRKRSMDHNKKISDTVKNKWKYDKEYKLKTLEGQRKYFLKKSKSKKFNSPSQETRSKISKSMKQYWLNKNKYTKSDMNNLQSLVMKKKKHKKVWENIYSIILNQKIDDITNYQTFHHNLSVNLQAALN